MEIFRDLHFELSFTDALIHMPKFAPMFKKLLNNKDKLIELTKTPLNENCSAIVLKKLPEKLGDPGRFLIPCDFTGLDNCLALANLGASINLMPFSIWKKLRLPTLNDTKMVLELADRTISKPTGVAENVFVKVGEAKAITTMSGMSYKEPPIPPPGVNQQEPTKVTTDTELPSLEDIQPPLVQVEKLRLPTLNDTKMVLELADRTISKPTGVAENVFVKMKFLRRTMNIVSNSSPNLTPFNESDFLLMEEADAFIAIHDEPISPEFNATYYDPEGDIFILEALLNNDPEPQSNQKDYFPSVRKVLKVLEPKNQSSDDEPPEVELKELPPYLEYAFLGDNENWPVIIAKDLNINEKTALIN
nr:reverse transcriptase domain-containing protein [Tanacetum cinerariifolium]